MNNTMGGRTDFLKEHHIIDPEQTHQHVPELYCKCSPYQDPQCDGVVIHRNYPTCEDENDFFKFPPKASFKILTTFNLRGRGELPMAALED